MITITGVARNKQIENVRTCCARVARAAPTLLRSGSGGGGGGGGGGRSQPLRERKSVWRSDRAWRVRGSAGLANVTCVAAAAGDRGDEVEGGSGDGGGGDDERRVALDAALGPSST